MSKKDNVLEKDLYFLDNIHEILHNITYYQDVNRINLSLLGKPVFLLINNLEFLEIIDNEIILKINNDTYNNITSMENHFIELINEKKEEWNIQCDTFKSLVKIITDGINEEYIIKIKNIYQIFNNTLDPKTSISIVFHLPCIWHYDNLTGLFLRPLYVSK